MTRLPVAEAAEKSAKDAAFVHEGWLRRGSDGALTGDGLAVVGTGDGVHDLGLIEVLRPLDKRHVSDENAIAHHLGLKTCRPVGIPLRLAPARQGHTHAELASPPVQVSVDATIAEGVNHPERLELIHVEKLMTVTEGPLKAGSVSYLTSYPG
jgi:hypothetical protein